MICRLREDTGRIVKHEFIDAAESRNRQFGPEG